MGALTGARCTLCHIIEGNWCHGQNKEMPAHLAPVVLLQSSVNCLHQDGPVS